MVTKLDVACSEHPEFEHCIDLYSKVPRTCNATVMCSHHAVAALANRSSGLGREELAAVEMSVLFGARYFAGAHASALSSIV